MVLVANKLLSLAFASWQAGRAEAARDVTMEADAEPSSPQLECLDGHAPPWFKLFTGKFNLFSEKSENSIYAFLAQKMFWC